MRGGTLIFVCSYGCVVGPDVTGGRVVPGPCVHERAGEGPTSAQLIVTKYRYRVASGGEV